MFKVEKSPHSNVSSEVPLPGPSRLFLLPSDTISMANQSEAASRDTEHKEVYKGKNEISDKRFLVKEDNKVIPLE